MRNTHITCTHEALTNKPNAHEQDYSGERQGLGRLIDPGHCVNKTPHTKKWQCKEATGKNHIPDPVMATNLLKQISRHITRNTSSEGIEQDGSGVHRMVSVHIKHAQESHHYDGHTQCEELAAISCTFTSSHDATGQV